MKLVTPKLKSLPVVISNLPNKPLYHEKDGIPVKIVKKVAKAVVIQNERLGMLLSEPLSKYIFRKLYLLALKILFMPSTKAFQKKILAWYATHKRDLPWRKTTDPYAVLISEVMLQQTQVDRVIPKYLAWLERFPNFASLAEASVADVLTLWSGLGYNSRAVRLHKLAQEVVATYGGKLPKDPSLLLSLPGIGPYTCKSVLIFAGNADLACIDTNIRRIFISEFGLDPSLSQKELEVFALSVLPRGKSRDWHNALMDYGSQVLTSRKSGVAPVSKQPKFAGSRRMYRGKIVKLLIAEGSLSVSAPGSLLQKDEPFVRDVLADLEKGGLVAVTGDTARLAS